ncbi:MAG: hypothetical protein IT324_10020 [Anaerolineae bacterium]|nr:hypothetical protein [Anaerolineae bacterium]
MKRSLFLLSIVVLASFTLVLQPTQRTLAAVPGNCGTPVAGSSVGTGLGAPSTFNVPVLAGDLIYAVVTSTNGAPVQIETTPPGGSTVIAGATPSFVELGVTATSSGTATVFVADSGPAGGTRIATVYVCPPSNSNRVTWFNPGDNRVNGWAGDRIAVYCNTAPKAPDVPNVDVWGMDNSGKGTRLARVIYTDLVAAGTNGLALNLGANGTIFIGVAANGTTLWAAWQGGPYNATGKGDFAKVVSCLGFKK